MREAGQAGAVLARLAAADGIPAVLAAGWEAFEFIRVVCAHGADPGSGLYAAYMFAAAAAADGRDAVGFAPSMPAAAFRDGSGPPGHRPRPGDPAIAGLAAGLAGQLGGAAALAVAPGDADALGQAAREARRISELLTGAGP